MGFKKNKNLVDFKKNKEIKLIYNNNENKNKERYRDIKDKFVYMDKVVLESLNPEQV